MKVISLFSITLCFVSVISCTQHEGSKNTKHNPKVDTIYFYPADSGSIVSQTSFSNYTIKTTVSPIKGKYVIIYLQHSNGKKMTTDKILLRDYVIEVDLSNANGFLLKKVITKYDIPFSILKFKVDHEFFRKVNFNGFNRNEFRFDMKLSPTTDEGPYKIIKCYIFLDGLIRFEDYPKRFYDSAFPSPD